MLNFLRKLRRKEMNNKTGRYFKYAVGEIVLVVIGILIALSINNWNEQLKIKRWEAKFLNDLHNEITADLQQLKNVHSKQSIIRESSSLAIDLIKRADQRDFKKIDSVYVLSQMFNPTFFPATGVYDSGLSAGKIEHLSNDALKYAIMNLYNHYYKRLVYNGVELDDVVEKVDWEKIKFFDENTLHLRSWEGTMDFELLAQINFTLAQVIIYTNLAENTMAEMERILELIFTEIEN